jgi:hypothetical protein
MALMPIDSARRQVLELLKKMQPLQGLDIRSYKRNRAVMILLQDRRQVLVRERGYREQEFLVAQSELAKILKTIFKREFPRSRKVRIYQLAGPDEMEIVRKKL